MFIRLPKLAWKCLSPPDVAPYMLQLFEEPLSRCRWAPGSRAKTLERYLARQLGVPPEWVVATRSATVALEAAARFFLPPDEPVRVSPLTFHSTYSGAINAGLEVQFVDVDEEGWPTDQVDIGVDLWGRRFPAPCRILDSAHRLLAPEHGALVADGTAVVFSFDFRKEAPCLVGGALIHRDLATTYAREWLHFGLGPDRVPIPGLGGTNGGLPDPLAAWATASVKRLGVTYRRRQAILEQYQAWLGSSLLTLPVHATGHVAVLRFGDAGTRALVDASLRKAGCETSLHYPLPAGTDCPGAEALTLRLLSVPCHAGMKPVSDVRKVCQRIINA